VSRLLMPEAWMCFEYAVFVLRGTDLSIVQYIAVALWDNEDNAMLRCEERMEGTSKWKSSAGL